MSLLFCLPSFAVETRLSAMSLDSGKHVDVQIEAGKKALVVTFLSAKCPCSDSHIVAMKQAVEKFPEFTFVAVHSNTDESKELSEDYFKKAKLGFPVLQDEGLRLADQFGAYKTPHAFVVDKDGVILYRGGVSDSKDFAKSKRHFLEEALSDIKAGASVKTAEGRTLGCVITRGDEKAPWSSR